MWPFSGHQGFARELSVHRGEPVTVRRQEWRTTSEGGKRCSGTDISLLRSSPTAKPLHTDLLCFVYVTFFVELPPRVCISNLDMRRNFEEILGPWANV